MSKYAGKTREQIMRELEEARRARYDAKYGAGAYDKAEQERIEENKRWCEFLAQRKKETAELQHMQAVQVAQYYAAQGTAPDACILAALRR